MRLNEAHQTKYTHECLLSLNIIYYSDNNYHIDRRSTCVADHFTPNLCVRLNTLLKLHSKLFYILFT